MFRFTTLVLAVARHGQALSTTQPSSTVSSSMKTSALQTFAIPSGSPTWSISPSPPWITSNQNKNTAAIVAGVVGVFAFLTIVAVAFFTLRKRISFPWTKHNGKWHNLGKGGGDSTLQISTNNLDPYHDTRAIAPSLPDQVTYVAKPEGRKLSLPITPLSKIHDSRYSSPFDPFSDPVVTGDHKKSPSYIHDKGIDYIEMAPDPSDFIGTCVTT
ncbi:hypothetical protein L208DRAFT_1409203, partial [Tricholoma matsutake]